MLVSVQFPAIFFQKTFVSEGITQQGHSWQELAPHYATEPKVSEVNEPWKLRTPHWAWSLVSARTFGQPSYAVKEEKISVYVLEGWCSQAPILHTRIQEGCWRHPSVRTSMFPTASSDPYCCSDWGSYSLEKPHEASERAPTSLYIWRSLPLRLPILSSASGSSLNPRSTTPLQLVLGEIFGSQRLHSKLKELDQWVFPSQL